MPERSLKPRADRGPSGEDWLSSRRNALWPAWQCCLQLCCPIESQSASVPRPLLHHMAGTTPRADRLFFFSFPPFISRPPLLVTARHRELFSLPCRPSSLAWNVPHCNGWRFSTRWLVCMVSACLGQCRTTRGPCLLAALFLLAPWARLPSAYCVITLLRAVSIQVTIMTWRWAKVPAVNSDQNWHSRR